jgi:F-type H+-transporting ATPase subunit b
MDETLRQVGGLLLGSIPTIFFFVALYMVYTLVVHKPLLRVLAERRSRTEGAMEQARHNIRAAERRTAEYEQKLREVRLALFKRMESRREQAAQLRAMAVEQARVKAQAEVEKARAAMEEDKKIAQRSLEEESGPLAAEIIRSVLKPAEPALAGGR